MADFDRGAPVLVAAGESSGRSLGVDWPCPADLAGVAIKTALADSGQAHALAGLIDCIAATRTFEDSGLSFGTGSPDNVPEAYAKAGALAPRHFIYADVGGQSPQALVSDLAAAVQQGEYRGVVIAGAEANGTAKRARKEGRVLDWRQVSDTPFEDRISAFPILSRPEIRHGIVSMPLAYSLIETARRVSLKMNEAAYESEMATLWAAFSGKSLTREHAQFARLWSAEELQQDAGGNYRLTQIYRRWMVAQDAVDVGAALILTTAGTAQDIGIAPSKMIWLAGTAQASEPPISERSHLSGSRAQEFAIAAALDQAGLTAADLGPVDIYSCFPCAVFAATDTLGSPQRELADYTLTGGLSFFGGPGNGYSLHSLAAMVQALRADGSRPAMVTANGGVMSKQAVGIYTAQQPRQRWTGKVMEGYQADSLALDPAPQGKGRILTFARPIVKDVIGPATLLLKMENGARALAVLEDVPDIELAGAIVEVTPAEKRHKAVLSS
jgi:acetyl-CoA C-acetyltransferase